MDGNYWQRWSTTVDLYRLRSRFGGMEAIEPPRELRRLLNLRRGSHEQQEVQPPSPEVRERAVRMVPEHRGESPSAELRPHQTRPGTGSRGSEGWHANWQGYGVDKVWKQMYREGII